VKTWRDEDLIEVLACEIDERPTAPGPQELSRFIRSASIGPEALVLGLDEAGKDVADAFVAAEQVCCADIGWSLESSPALSLRITATAPQLKVLAALVPNNIDIERVQ
jgi:hypothetical protein